MSRFTQHKKLEIRNLQLAKIVPSSYFQVTASPKGVA